MNDVVNCHPISLLVSKPIQTQAQRYMIPQTSHHAFPYTSTVLIYPNIQRLLVSKHSRMAPSLEEPIQVDLAAPLKAAPKLVAPEPGTRSVTPLGAPSNQDPRRTLSRS